MASSKKPQRASNASTLAQHLHSFLRQHTAPTRHLVLGLSGGMDSCVLLHLLVQARQQSEFQFSAIHVNHQISPNADDWGNFCAELCVQYGVDFQSVKVDVPQKSGLGLEAAAREARYAVFLAQQGDILLAHHQDDQAETLLLQLLRGAGVNGLAAMPRVREDAAKRLLRPLLDVPRSQLLNYAYLHDLKWIEDESNDSLQYDRNFLRHEVLPVLGKRFTGYRTTLARAASNLAEAAALLEQVALEDAAIAVQDKHLDIGWLKAATAERAMNLLRWWIRDSTGLNPGSARLHDILNQLCHAKPNAQVACKLGDAVLRRYRKLAYIDRGDYAQAYRIDWHGEEVVDLPSGGQLYFKQVVGEGVSSRILKEGLVITNRLGAAEEWRMALRLDCNRPTRSLKNLWQEAGVPPRERDCSPLFWDRGALVFVLGIGIDCVRVAGENEAGILVTFIE